MDELTMEPMEEALPPDPNTPLNVVDVMFRSGGKVYFFDPGELDIPAGAHVIIDTSRGVEFGTCTAGNHTVRAAEVVMPLRSVLRIATAADERMAEENHAKEKDAYDICLRKIEESGLEMQLVSAEYAFDGSKILFFFTADGRVDFRELVKSLASVFRTRIELRQIGVRDKAKMVGGLGVCGRPFCCSQFLEDFQPVSIKMAKVQNLSLNPTKISGTCGRLMCCLKYEQEAYEDLLRTSPRAESFVDTPDGRGTVTEVNLLRQSVKVRMEDHPEEIKSFANGDICVLRSGKAHKNDPPIPKEIAPISGGKEKDYKPRLRSTAPGAANPEPEAAPEEPVEKRRKPKPPKAPQEPKDAEPKEAPVDAEKQQEKSSRRRPRGGKPHPEGEKQPKPRPEGEKQPKPRPEGEKQQRSNRSHHKPKGPRPEGEKQPQKPEKQPQKQPEKAEPRPEGENKPNPNRSNHHRRRRPSGPKPEKPSGEQ